jgi:uncharacterized protein
MSKITFELPAHNMDRAKTFYQNVFGWRIDPLPTLDYLVINTDGRPIDPTDVDGGITRSNALVQAPVLIITVEALDEAREKVQTAGGNLLTPKTRVAEYGWSCYAKDTEGNVLCLWENLK